MGILSDMGSADADGGGHDDADAPDDKDADLAAADAGKDAKEEKAERVELPKATRRGEGRGRTAGIEKAVADLAKQIADRDEKYRADLAQRDTHIAELRGRFEQQQAQARQPAAPAAPDPAALRKAARKALDSQDFDEYQTLTTQAVVAEMEQKFGPRLNGPAPSAQQIPLPVQAVLASFPDVMSHPKGMDLAVIEDRRLALDGIPDGPDRYRRAFEITRAQLGKPAPAGYSQNTRGVLAGVPPGRNGAPGAAPADPGVNLSRYELEVAQRCGMTKEEYARFVAEAHPERLQQ